MTAADVNHVVGYACLSIIFLGLMLWARAEGKSASERNYSQRAWVCLGAMWLCLVVTGMAFAAALFPLLVTLRCA